MSAFLKALQSFLQAMTLLLTLARDEKLRREGERRVLHKQVESAYEQRGEAHEIDLQVVRNGLSVADLERMRRYQRTTS